MSELQHVAQAAQGHDTHVALLKFLTQTMDIQLDAFRADVIVQAENLFKQLLARHRPRTAKHQHRQQRLLARRQRQRLSAE